LAAGASFANAAGTIAGTVEHSTASAAGAVWLTSAPHVSTPATSHVRARSDPNMVRVSALVQLRLRRTLTTTSTDEPRGLAAHGKPAATAARAYTKRDAADGVPDWVLGAKGLI